MEIGRYVHETSPESSTRSPTLIFRPGKSLKQLWFLSYIDQCTWEYTYTSGHTHFPYRYLPRKATLTSYTHFHTAVWNVFEWADTTSCLQKTMYYPPTPLFQLALKWPASPWADNTIKALCSCPCTHCGPRGSHSHVACRNVYEQDPGNCFGDDQGIRTKFEKQKLTSILRY